MKYSKYILILFAAFTLNVYATKVAPTAQGAYYSGVKAYGYTVTFTGSGCHDNDDQNGGSTPQYQWDFDYVGTTFTVDAATTNTLVTHAYNAPGTFRVGVKYMDNDGQWSQPYPFTITIREVRRVFYVKDHLGNIRQSINESGTVVSAQDYYPYGETLRGYISVHPYEKYRFTEKERDIETGYDYFGGRLYDPALPMWLQVDPLSDKYPGVSPYNYCFDNPLRLVDPDGKEVKGYTEKLKSSTSIPAAIAQARHSFIKVTTPTTSVILELGGPTNQTSPKGNPLSTKVDYGYDPAISIVDVFNNKFEKGGRLDPSEAKVTRPENSPEGDFSFENKILEIFNIMKNNLPNYNGMGSNSNGFIKFLIEAAGGQIDLPWTAYYQDEVDEYRRLYEEYLKKEEDAQKAREIEKKE